jgi:ADP-ribose pyrophosphatase YjhB (NUDIX family)
MSLEVSIKLLDFSRSIAAIAQSGLYYCTDKYDEDRYTQLRAIASEILAFVSNVPFEQIHQILSLESGHATPKVDVRAACFNENGHILLVKEISDGRWSLPGGWAEVGLSPQESIVKEVREEAGLNIDVKSIIGIFNEEIEGVNRRLFHEYKILFSCTIRGKALKEGAPDEISEASYFSAASLPLLSTTRTSIHHLRECFKNRGDEITHKFFR